jgi:hypothetical protein
MANTSKKTALKGIKLYNFLLKELGEQNKSFPEKQQISITARRKIVSNQLYPKWKNAGFNNRTIKSDIKRIVKGIAPVEICNPIYLPEAYLMLVEYYEIDNHIRQVLPDCINVRVNAGVLGKTQIFNTKGYNYYSNGVKKIIENIREAMIDNSSGRANFDGSIKVIPNKKNDGNADNYFVDYILFINNEPQGDSKGATITLDKQQKKTKTVISNYIVDKFNVLEKEKKKRQRTRKKAIKTAKEQTPVEQKKKVVEKIQKAMLSFRDLLNAKIITKEEFEKQKALLMQQKKAALAVINKQK